ncbi:hypothetical protein E0I56_005675 [Escherichia coli]|nr:hypothetical protein [Escherichia coli]
MSGVRGASGASLVGVDKRNVGPDGCLSPEIPSPPSLKQEQIDELASSTRMYPLFLIIIELGPARRPVPTGKAGGK